MRYKSGEPVVSAIWRKFSMMFSRMRFVHDLIFSENRRYKSLTLSALRWRTMKVYFAFFLSDTSPRRPYLTTPTHSQPGFAE
jgi:hypothetical protein